MIQRNIWPCLSIPVLCAIPVFFCFGQNTHTGTPARADTPEVAAKQLSAVGTYDATHECRKFRVTVLGSTKGVAFLASEELVGGGNRSHGSNAVPWLRINVLVERLTDDAFGPVGWQLQTDDGQNLVEETNIQTDGFSMRSRASGTAQMDMDFQCLTSALFPTAPPKVDNPDRSTVFAFTVSGQFRKTEKANLILGFGEGKQREEVVFKDVPIP